MIKTISRITSGLVAASITACMLVLLAAPASALTYVGGHRFQPRTSVDLIRTNAVFPDPGPAPVLLASGSNTGSEWMVFNQPDNGGGGVILKNRAAGLCLDTADGGNSTDLAARSCDNTISQNWTIVSVPGTNFGYFTVQNVFTKKYLTKTVGAVNLQNPTGSTLQHWAYIPTGN